MQLIKAEIRKGVLEVLSIPKGIKMEVTDKDSGEVCEITENPENGEPQEIILNRFEALR